MSNSALSVIVRAPLRSQYVRRSSWKDWFEHFGAISVIVSFGAALIGFGLIWVYLQFIKMPELFIPSIISNPVVPFAITGWALLAVVMGGFLLFIPAIVIWLWELLFKIQLPLKNKSALFLSQICILVVYAGLGGTAAIWLDVAILLVVLMAICFVIVRKTIKNDHVEIPRSELVKFVVLSGFFGFYWVFSLSTRFKETGLVDTDDEFVSVMSVWVGLILLPLAPVLLQWLLERKLQVPLVAKVGFALAYCFLVIAIFIPLQTTNVTMVLAGVRQKPQDPRYYWIDKKYVPGISEKMLRQEVPTSTLKAWDGIVGDDGAYVFGYRLFQLSEVTVLCSKYDTGLADDPNSRCFQANSIDVRLMPRSFSPEYSEVQSGGSSEKMNLNLPNKSEIKA